MYVYLGLFLDFLLCPMMSILLLHVSNRVERRAEEAEDLKSEEL